MQLFISRVERDESQIAEMEREVRIFLAEIASTVTRLTERYGTP